MFSFSLCVYYKQQVNTSVYRRGAKQDKKREIRNNPDPLKQKASSSGKCTRCCNNPRTRMYTKGTDPFTTSGSLGLGVSARCAISSANGYSPHRAVSAGAHGRQVLVALRDLPHGFVELLSIESGSLLLRHSCGFTSSSQRKLLPSPPSVRRRAEWCRRSPVKL